jgi:hypothetical protein
MEPIIQNLPMRQPREPSDLQDALKKKTETDPRVNYALGILDPTLNPLTLLGIQKATTSSSAPFKMP